MAGGVFRSVGDVKVAGEGAGAFVGGAGVEWRWRGDRQISSGCGRFAYALVGSIVG